MENKKNRLKLFKSIGAIISAVVVTIVAVSLPFLSNLDSKTNSKNLVALADSVTSNYEFSGSNHITFSTLRNFTSDVKWPLFINVNFKVMTFGNYYSIFADGEGYEVESNANIDEHNFSFYDLATKTKYNESNYNSLQVPLGESHMYTLCVPDLINAWGIHFGALTTQNFNANIIAVELGLTNTAKVFPYSSSNIKYFYFKYYSDIVNNEYIYIEFLTPAVYDFNTRTYYFSDTESTEYQQGYNEGFNEGNNVGYASGYSAGDKAGYSTGFSAGRLQGMQDASDYTFFSLVSAVIDAPIQAFMGLFNFKLLGINLAGFFTGLLTLAFIITIVRLVMP